MSLFKISVASTDRVGFGEGPHWDSENEILYYVDCLAKGLVELDFKQSPVSQKTSKLNLDSEYVTAAIPTNSRQRRSGESEKEFLTISKDKLLLISPECAEHTLLHKVTGHHFNDGKCDSKGRLWVGEWADKLTQVAGECALEAAVRFGGNLCSLDSNLFTRHTGGFTGTNGICFSPDERMIYTVDSAECAVVGQEFDVQAGIPNEVKRTVFHLDREGLEFDKKSILDGIVADIKGNLWIAIFMEGKVLNVDVESGKIVNEICFAEPLTTSLCFGGREMSELFVTSCEATLPNWSDHVITGPNAGHTFRVTFEKENSFKGMKMHSYSG